MQRYRCNGCRKTFSELQDRPLGTMRLPIEKAIQILQLLVEGMSIRSTERVTGVEKKTILSLLERVGVRCEMLLENLIREIPVRDIQCDELWGYVQMKEKTKTRKAPTSEKLGDAYCFVAVERDRKLILSWHLGRRSAADTNLFMFSKRTIYIEELDLQKRTGQSWPEFNGWFTWRINKKGLVFQILIATVLTAGVTVLVGGKPK